MDGKPTKTSQQNTFDRIVIWNELMGNNHLPLGHSDLQATRELGPHLLEELHELLDQIDGAPVDPVRVCKEAGDMIFVLVELIRRIGGDPQTVLNLVCDSNDTKVCRTVDEIDAAKASFASQGIEYYMRETPSGVAFKSACPQIIKGHEITEGKILKVPNFAKAEPHIRDHFRELLGAQDND